MNHKDLHKRLASRPPDIQGWQEFRDAGLLWFCNRILHIFGWAIILEMCDQGNVIAAYPQRVDYIGFSRDSEIKGFLKTRLALADTMPELASSLLEDIEKEE